MVSNDADRREALRIIKEEADKRVGVISLQEPIAEGMKRNIHFFRYIRPRTRSEHNSPTRCQDLPPLRNLSDLA